MVSRLFATKKFADAIPVTQLSTATTHTTGPLTTPAAIPHHPANSTPHAIQHPPSTGTLPLPTNPLPTNGTVPSAPTNDTAVNTRITLSLSPSRRPRRNAVVNPSSPEFTH